MVMKKTMPYFDIVVANRLPYRWDTQEISTGGVATACISMMTPDSVWIGIDDGSNPQIVRPDRHGREMLPRESGYEGYQRRIRLPRDEAEGHYRLMSNGNNWFIDHDKPEHSFGYSLTREGQYNSVNRRMAQAARNGKRIIVHDYHYPLVPKFIREMKGRGAIVFFNHIPAMKLSTYRSIPGVIRTLAMQDPEKYKHFEGMSNEDIENLQRFKVSTIEGPLYSDLIGFQILPYLHDYIESVGELIPDARIKENLDGSFTIEYKGRKARADAFPISIDTSYVRKNTRPGKEINYTFGDGVDLGLEIESAHAKGELVVLKIARLDPTKAYPENMLTLEKLANELYDEGIRFKGIFIGAPSRERLPAYIDYRAKTQRTAIEINERMRNRGYDYDLILFEYEGIPFGESSLCSFRDCDISFDAKEIDGMVLTTKETIESKAQLTQEKRGFAVTSWDPDRCKGAGVGYQLGEAGFGPEDGIVILKDPMNVEESAKAIKEAVLRRYNVSDRLVRFGRRNNIRKWVSDIEESLEKTVTSK